MKKLFSYISIKNLRTKLLLSYLLVVVLPIIAIGGYYINHISSSVLKEAVKTEERSVLQLRENIKAALMPYIDMSQDVYLNKRLVQYFNWSYINPGASAEGFYMELEPLITKYHNLRPEIGRITIYTRNRTMLANDSEIAYLEENTVEAEMYKEAVKYKGKILWKYQPGDSGKNYLQLYRLLNLNNLEIGMLVINIPEYQLYQYIKEDSGEDEVYIVGPGNLIMTSSVKEKPGKSVEELPYYSSIKDNEFTEENYNSLKNNLKVLSASIDLGYNSPDRWKIVKAYPVQRLLSEVNRSKIRGLIILILVLSFAAIMAVIFSNNISKRIKRLSKQMKKVQDGDFDVQVDVLSGDEVGQLGASFNTMVTRLNELIEQVYSMQLREKDMEIKKREAELYALQSQINPHFLFNSLEAILMGIEENNKETTRVIQLLAKCFRRSIQWNKEIVLLKEELDFIKDYLAIQKFRMGDKLSWSIEVDDSLLTIEMPKLILQPIVENAVNHGIALKKGTGNLKILVLKVPGGISISIEDDGIGIKAEEINNIYLLFNNTEINKTGRHIGVKNVYDRIKLYYGDRGLLNIQSNVGKGTVVQILMPYNE
jgi:two-component system, sensor histidine kinase YesM